VGSALAVEFLCNALSNPRTDAFKLARVVYADPFTSAAADARGDQPPNGYFASRQQAPRGSVRSHVATTTGHRFVRDARAFILPSDCCWQ